MLACANLRDGVAASRVPCVRQRSVASSPAARWNWIAHPSACRSWASRPARGCSIGRQSRFGEIAGAGFRSRANWSPAAGEGVQQRRLPVALRVLAQSGCVPGDQPVAVELDQPVSHGARRAARQNGASDQDGGHKRNPVEERQYGMVLFVEPRQSGDAIQLLGTANLG